MPFTVAHAFYALPIRYIKPKYFSTTGLILGSMSPDLEYFLYLEPYRSIGHTWQGLWLQAIPLCVILAALYHYIVKEQLAKHLPSLWQLNERFHVMMHQEQLRSLRGWCILITSVIFGFVTHIVLDEFTHAHSLFRSQLPWIWEHALLGLPIYKLLQYSASVVGLLGLAGLFLYGLLRIRKEQGSTQVIASIRPMQKLFYWIVVAIVALTVTILKLVVSTSGNTLGIVIVAPISGFVLGIIIASMIVRYQASKALYS